MLIVYVDNIAITFNDENHMLQLKSFFDACFQIKDLKSLKYYLGIEISCSKQGMYLSQMKFCLDMLNDVGLIKVKPCDTLMISNTNLTPDDGDLLEKPKIYQIIVGKVNYIVYNPTQYYISSHGECWNVYNQHNR